MPAKKAETKTELPKKKLREFLDTPITVTRMVFRTSRFGDYVLLITDGASIISSGAVVLKNAHDLEANLPATVTPRKVAGKNHEYFILE